MGAKALTDGKKRRRVGFTQIANRGGAASTLPPPRPPPHRDCASLVSREMNFSYVEGKALENLLDSAVSISVLPVIEITIEEIPQSKLNTMMGVKDREHVDEALYGDFESAKARDKRLVKEAHFQEKQAKNVALGKKVKVPSAAK